MNKALFVDMDGTLITTISGREFPVSISDWKFIPETVRAIKDYYVNGYKIIIVTNQGGIEAGYVKERDVIRKLGIICSELKELININTTDLSYNYCKNLEGFRRKPNPAMAYESALEYDLFLGNCVMFGDMESDKDFSYNAGIGEYWGIESIMIKFRDA